MGVQYDSEDVFRIPSLHVSIRNRCSGTSIVNYSEDNDTSLLLEHDEREDKRERAYLKELE